MLKFTFAATALLAAAPSFAAEPPPLPEAARQMLQKALDGGNDAEIATIAKYAIAANPDAKAEVDAIVNRYRTQKDKARTARLSNARFWALWDGKIELGGFRSTGSTSEVGISAALGLKRTGLKWTHALSASVDYRRANGRTSTERVVAAYQPRYAFDPRGFAYGLVQYEHDPFLGYDARYTGSAGIGYKLVDGKKVQLSVDAGPSVRHAQYTDDGTETHMGARTSLDLSWKLNPALTFRQTASGYAEKDVQSLTALTALDARLIAKLTARFSYNVQYETDTKLTDEKLDTLSKVTLIYDF